MIDAEVNFGESKMWIEIIFQIGFLSQGINKISLFQSPLFAVLPNFVALRRLHAPPAEVHPPGIDINSEEY